MKVKENVQRHLEDGWEAQGRVTRQLPALRCVANLRES